ncbi:hypothetical protein [Sphaerisporangium rhizosphaerae]|uniref:Phage tail protein n=1 Tax=Sphaerisporangium rhizosphaerae TaxID=2269375 RepID=A0ABW2NU09_9ACTN
MAKLVLLNTRIFAGAADLTGNSNQVEMSSEVEEKDVTAFQAAGSGGWKDLIGGLASTKISASGQWEATTNAQSIDPTTWDNLTALRQQPWTIAPETTAVGDLAYFTKALRTTYKIGDAVGEVAPWEGEATGSSLLLRGVIAHPPATARTANGTGTGINLGALSSTQRLYASLHVLSLSGTSTPTITVRVESSADNIFGSPTTRATFSASTQADTASRGQFVNVTGPITDAWWRLAWTVSGTTPSFLFTSALGIA